MDCKDTSSSYSFAQPLMCSDRNIMNVPYSKKLQKVLDDPQGRKQLRALLHGESDYGIITLSTGETYKFITSDWIRNNKNPVVPQKKTVWVKILFGLFPGMIRRVLNENNRRR